VAVVAVWNKVRKSEDTWFGRLDGELERGDGRDGWKC